MGDLCQSVYAIRVSLCIFDFLYFSPVKALISHMSGSVQPIKKYWVIVDTFSEQQTFSENLLVVSPPVSIPPGASSPGATAPYWPDLTDAVYLLYEAYIQVIGSAPGLSEPQLLQRMRSQLSDGAVTFTYPETERYTNYSVRFSSNRSLVREPDRPSLVIYNVTAGNTYTEVRNLEQILLL